MIKVLISPINARVIPLFVLIHRLSKKTIEIVENKANCEVDITEKDIENFINDKFKTVVAISVRDKFGDYVSYYIFAFDYFPGKE